jgi:hypothetical protein
VVEKYGTKDEEAIKLASAVNDSAHHSAVISTKTSAPSNSGTLCLSFSNGSVMATTTGSPAAISPLDSRSGP